MDRRRSPLIVSVVLLLTVVVAVVVAGNDSCWNGSGECVVKAILHQSSLGGNASIDLPMEIDCRSVGDDTLNDTTDNDLLVAGGEYLLRRFERTENLSLDGCNTPLGVATYGLEFLPNCNRVTTLSVEKFNVDILMPVLCPRSNGNDEGLRLEELIFRRNEIATVTRESLETVGQLRVLHFIGNSLRHIDSQAFDNLQMIEIIQIEEEPLLAIKQPEAGLFERTSVRVLRLKHLKRLTPLLGSHLPDSLEELHVAHTPIAEDSLNLVNPQKLRNVSIIACGLRAFALSDMYSSVRHINLSGNAIADFQLNFSENSSSPGAVESIDLSENQLTHLPGKWFGDAVSRTLRYLALNGNSLKTFDLWRLLATLPAVQWIDLRDNKLTSIVGSIDELTPRIDYFHRRIRIDGNPWNCIWLLDFAHSYPEEFRVFQYEKFISHINVNGLECRAEEEAQAETEAEAKATATATTNALRNPGAHPLWSVSTSPVGENFPGSPLNAEFKRNQRAEAWIIVVMLPLGIAMLFLLLYMWIYCQKVFHWSYYRSSFQNAGVRSTADRFDVVRHLPPSEVTPISSMVNTPFAAAIATATDGHTAVTFDGANNNSGYETPLNGIGSVCNCNISRDDNDEKCSRARHITYEALPEEPPFKIYEEIINVEDIGDGDDDNQQTMTKAQAHENPSAHPFYERLTFE